MNSFFKHIKIYLYLFSIGFLWILFGGSIDILSTFSFVCSAFLTGNISPFVWVIMGEMSGILQQTPAGFLSIPVVGMSFLGMFMRKYSSLYRSPWDWLFFSISWSFILLIMYLIGKYMGIMVWNLDIMMKRFADTVLVYPILLWLSPYVFRRLKIS